MLRVNDGNPEEVMNPGIVKSKLKVKCVMPGRSCSPAIVECVTQGPEIGFMGDVPPREGPDVFALFVRSSNHWSTLGTMAVILLIEKYSHSHEGIEPPGHVDDAASHSTLPSSSSLNRSTLTVVNLTPASTNKDKGKSSSPMSNGILMTHPIRGVTVSRCVVVRKVAVRGDIGGAKV